jgi:hypothetical protein
MTNIWGSINHRFKNKPEDCFWEKMRRNNKDIISVENLLNKLEDDYTSACVRYLTLNTDKDTVLILRSFDGKKKQEPIALIINSGSTVVPVLNGLTELPMSKSLNDFLKTKKIYSIQGLKKEVLILEDLMSLESFMLKEKKNQASGLEGRELSNLTLRVPRMTDLDALAPLQAAYEHEEVLHKGSIFSAAASRVNLAKTIAGGKILTVSIDGRFIGKINVSGISFTRYLVGGVYVRPDFRGKGIARLMTAKFIRSLLSESRGVTLFVKKANLAAYKLYAGLGFKVRGDYRITYYL